MHASFEEGGWDRRDSVRVLKRGRKMIVMKIRILDSVRGLKRGKGVRVRERDRNSKQKPTEYYRHRRTLGGNKQGGLVGKRMWK